MKINFNAVVTSDETAKARQRGQMTVNGIIGNTIHGIRVDDNLKTNSSNPILDKLASSKTSGQMTVNGIIGNTRYGIKVDATLDPNSSNPISNKAVAAALATLTEQLVKGQLIFVDQLPETGEPQKRYVLTATNQRFYWDEESGQFIKIVPSGGEVTPTIDFGNLKKNETYHFDSIQDLLNKRLVSYVDASNASAAVKPNNGGTFENGASISITGITIRAKKGSTEITKVSANDGTKSYEVDAGEASAAVKLGD